MNPPDYKSLTRLQPQALEIILLKLFLNWLDGTLSLDNGWVHYLLQFIFQSSKIILVCVIRPSFCLKFFMVPCVVYIAM